jgi:hypothetical protein
LAQYVSVFHAGLSGPAPWDNALVEARGKPIGVNVALGLTTNVGASAGLQLYSTIILMCAYNKINRTQA